jgi:lytic murein transglycosylase
MHRRLFLLSSIGALAVPSLPGCVAQPMGDDPIGDLAAASARPGTLIGTSGDAAFDSWLSDFYARALRAGWDDGLLIRELSGLTPDPRVVASDTKQPEFSKPTGDYIKGAVSDARVTRGAAARSELTYLPGIEQRFGVPGEILIAIWGMESAFGAVMGDADVIRSIASLAADGRRRSWAEAQLFAALRMIAEGDVTRAQLKGSWAGAMGQTQFIPETYLSTAVDGDGDGRRDIWGSTADALASAANLLSKAGWRRGESWQREVTLPQGFDYSLTEGPKNLPPVWAGLGVVAADGYGWSAEDARAEAQLILPSGAAGPAFLVFPNHFTIRRYNNSTAYALGVGLLADRVAGRAPLVRPWPVEVGLSAADRVSAQTHLNRLGFNAGTADGIIGVNTRAALRAWQKARGRVADGYLTVDLVRALEADPGA